MPLTYMILVDDRESSDKSISAPIDKGGFAILAFAGSSQHMNGSVIHILLNN